MLLQGMGIGLAIAAPVGVIGILCIQRTLTQGRWIGFVSGMGAATADGVYGCVAGLGLSAISDLLVAQSRWLMLVGGLFLLYLGVTTFRQRPPQGEKAPELSSAGVLKSFLSVFLLTLTNPLTIFSFLGIFSGLGLGQTSGEDSAILLVLGVFLGSALWWLLLSLGVSYLSRWFQPQNLAWLNRTSGVAITAFGIAALWRFWSAG